MNYITYGKTDKLVSIVGFGGLRFDLDKSNEELSYLVEYAYDKGITYFDTAPGYCNDRSEDILGTAFKRMIKNGKNDFIVSTKGRPTVFDTEEKSIEGVKKSIERLGVKKIDFYHIWCLRNMDHYELATKPGGQYDGLLKCKEEGLIDHIVFSSHQPGEQVERVIEEGKFEGVTMGLARHKMIYGKRFCPCFMVLEDENGKHKSADDRICPCPPAIEKEIPEEGKCHCGIFCTPEYAANNDQ